MAKAMEPAERLDFGNPGKIGYISAAGKAGAMLNPPLPTGTNVFCFRSATAASRHRHYRYLGWAGGGKCPCGLKYVV